MLTHFTKLLGIKSYIKIKGRTFNSLSNAEAASMIDAFLNGENENFEQNAMVEFTLMNYKSEKLQSLKGRIEQIQEQNKTAKEPDGLSSTRGAEELNSLKLELLKAG